MSLGEKMLNGLDPSECAGLMGFGGTPLAILAVTGDSEGIGNRVVGDLDFVAVGAGDDASVVGGSFSLEHFNHGAGLFLSLLPVEFEVHFPFFFLSVFRS